MHIPNQDFKHGNFIHKLFLIFSAYPNTMLIHKGITTFLCVLAFSTVISTLTAGLANSSAAPGSYDLLVIGPEAYRPHLERFIALKKSQCIATRYISVEYIRESLQIGDLTWRIHEFVANEYRNSGIKYLLLVGTYDQVPPKYVYSPSDEAGLADFNYKPTDWFYAVPDWQDSQIGLLNGNVPEIAVSRLPVKNSEELERTISKIVEVESQPLKGFFLVFKDDNLAFQPLLNVSDVYYASKTNLSDETLSQMLSGNVAYAATYTHGSPSALWTKTANGSYTPLITSGDIEQIKKAYGIHYLVACFAGALDLENESLAEALITSRKGPVLVIANSRTEILDTPLPSTFWENFFKTGDVAGSIVQSIQSYLSDTEFFSLQHPAFQKYNLYLCRVVYGDISWKVENPEKNILAYPPPASFMNASSESLSDETSEVECKEFSVFHIFTFAFTIYTLTAVTCKVKVKKANQKRVPR